MDSLFGRSTHPYGLLLAADARAGGWSSALHSALRRGEIAKVRPGAYLASRRWNDLAPLQRYLVRIHAVGLTFRSPLFSHQSAAALHGLPLLNRRADRIHLRATTPRGSGSRGDVTVHVGTGDPDVMECHGLRLTSPARTIMDLARTLPHGEALALADAAIRPRRVEGAIPGTDAPLCTKAELIDLAQEGITSRGGWNAYLAISEADPLSGSLGESMARSLIMRLGAPPPALQAALRDERGLIGYADFFWPQLGVVGEFDGRLKYGADNPSGAPPEVVVYREKMREDRIRRVSAGFFRFGWAELVDPPRLAALLRGVGVPLERSSAWPELRRQVFVGSDARVRLDR